MAWETLTIIFFVIKLYNVDLFFIHNLQRRSSTTKIDI